MSTSFSSTVAVVLTAAASVVSGQQTQGGYDTWPQLATQVCDSTGCKDETYSVVMDANWRGSPMAAFNTSRYETTYGISTASNALTMKYNDHDPKGMAQYNTFGGRTYLLDTTTHEYKMLQLLNREFTFTVDASNVPCYINGALYLVSMRADGGHLKAATEYGTQPSNGTAAGASYGTGYCDAQCQAVAYVDGVSNSGKTVCCQEMDLWEANNNVNAVTPHTCSGPTGADTTCFEGTKDDCDHNGCDANPFRLGNENSYGLGSSFTVDSSKPVTVVTQFLTSDGTDDGDLSEIKRFYVQDGKTIEMPSFKLDGKDIGKNSITDDFCDAKAASFHDEGGNTFGTHGGMKQMGEALKSGMVLVLSIWDDQSTYMNWLDSYVANTDAACTADKTACGQTRGSCTELTKVVNPSSSNTDYTTQDQGYIPATTQVIYSDFKWGTLNSTWGGDSSSTTSTTGTETATTTTTGTATEGSSGCSTGCWVATVIILVVLLLLVLAAVAVGLVMYNKRRDQHGESSQPIGIVNPHHKAPVDGNEGNIHMAESSTESEQLGYDNRAAAHNYYHAAATPRHSNQYQSSGSFTDQP